MRAVLLAGHGSLRRGSGAAMIRLAALAHARGVAPIVEAGFLNYSRPAFAEALARCVARGAAEVVVQPYFLVCGKFVSVDLPRLVAAGRAAHPNVCLALARPFGDHPALEALVLKRAAQASAAPASPNERGAGDSDRAALQAGTAGLLIMAHGSPDPSVNQPIHAIADRLQGRQYAHVAVGFMELNEPSVGTAIDDLVAHGARPIVAVPYFLQLGGHVAEDLPEIIGAARRRHPQATIILAEHLAYDELLVAAIADRVAEAGISAPPVRRPNPS